MPTSNKTIRQSVSLPANVAVQARNLAKTRRRSSNRMLVELSENGIETEKRKQQGFFELAENSETPMIRRKPSVSATNWAGWFFGGQ